MKRKLLYLYTLLLTFLSAGVLTGCSNEDIDIQRVGKLELRISTQKLYDTFNSTNSIKTRFLADEYSVGVTVFVYNENGVLVDEQFQHSKTFDSLSFFFPTLTAGRYTFVVAETLVEDENGYTSDDWVFENTSNLSTLEIKTNPESSRGSYHYWYSVVGTAVSTRNLDFEETTRIDLTPEAIGCVINYEAIHFGESDFAAVKLLTKDSPAGRYLSPDYKDNDRFHYDQYLGSNTWMGRGVTWIDDSKEMTGADVYLIESGDINYVYGAFEEDGSGYLQTSFYAFPKGGSNFKTYDGEIYYGGIAYQSSNGSYNCSTSLFREEASYNEWEARMLNSSTGTNNVAYINPYLVWGASSSAVESYMKGLTGATTFTNSNGDSNILSFRNYNETVQYDYYFNLQWANYGSLLVSYAKSSYTMDNVSALLANVGLENGGYVEELGGTIYYSESVAALAYYPEAYPEEIFVIFLPSASSAPRKVLKTTFSGSNSLKNFDKAKNIIKLRKETKSGL